MCVYACLYVCVSVCVSACLCEFSEPCLLGGCGAAEGGSCMPPTCCRVPLDCSSLSASVSWGSMETPWGSMEPQGVHGAAVNPRRDSGACCVTCETDGVFRGSCLHLRESAVRPADTIPHMATQEAASVTRPPQTSPSSPTADLRSVQWGDLVPFYKHT